MTTGLRRRWLAALQARRLLAALVGALTVIGGFAGPVQAQVVDCIENPATPFVNCNPGGHLVATNSLTQSLTFAPPTTKTDSISQYQTEIIGLSDGISVYDMTFAAAFGTPGDVLGQIEADRANLHDGWLLLLVNA